MQGVAKLLSCYYFNRDIDKAQRKTVLDVFASLDKAILVATSALRHSLYELDIRLVLHYRLLEGIKQYSQELGCASRDGHPATARVVLVAGI